jgi:hypothetical protein
MAPKRAVIVALVKAAVMSTPAARRKSGNDSHWPGRVGGLRRGLRRHRG